MGSCFSTDEALLTKEEALVKVSSNPHVLQYFSKKFKNDKEIVLAACPKDGMALEFASEELKENKEVVVAACFSNWRALQHAASDQSLKNDKDIFLASFTNMALLCIIRQIHKQQQGSVSG